MSLNIDNNNMIGSVRDNIRKLCESIGDTFMIKYGEIEIPIKITRTYNESFYMIQYNIIEKKKYIRPFEIIFCDYYTFEENDNCYISGIHKYKKISGTMMIKMVIRIIQYLNVKTAILIDGTKLHFENITVNLSLYRLITKGSTFYQQFGFRVSWRNIYDRILFSSLDDVNVKLESSIANIQKMSCKNIKDSYDTFINVLNEINSKRDYKNVKFYRMDSNYCLNIHASSFVVKKSKNQKKIKKLIIIFDELSKLLDNNILFVDFLKNLLSSNILLYKKVETNMLKYKGIIGMKYNEKDIYLDFINDISLIYKVKKMIYTLTIKI